MFNVGGGEVLVILVLALVVLGPNKLPEAARTFGKHLGDFRRMSAAFRSEINQAMDLGSFAGSTTAEPQAAASPSPAPAPQPEPAPAPAWRPTPPPTATTTDDDRSSTVWADGPVDSFV